ncbi:MAG: 30S ribosomal protein THX [Acidobacteria bacterium]|nr:30S ribosomal protein THX [Acidobacteriota bacterium]
MGKGDKRTRKGKISAGSYGKTRPKGGKKRPAANRRPANRPDFDNARPRPDVNS